MIMGCFNKHEIGERLTGLTDEQGVYHEDQPFVIVRASTFEEWYADASAPECQAMPAEQLAFARSGKAFFYEIATD